MNGQKMQTASSSYTHDESDRGSLHSAATIDVKELIKKCLRNLRGRNSTSGLVGDRNDSEHKGGRSLIVRSASDYSDQ